MFTILNTFTVAVSQVCTDCTSDGSCFTYPCGDLASKAKAMASIKGVLFVIVYSFSNDYYFVCNMIRYIRCTVSQVCTDCTSDGSCFTYPCGDLAAKTRSFAQLSGKGVVFYVM